jgi:hypothetical protein
MSKALTERERERVIYLAEVQVSISLMKILKDKRQYLVPLRVVMALAEANFSLFIHR